MTTALLRNNVDMKDQARSENGRAKGDTQMSPIAPEQPKQNRWILNPGVDLMFCCGGLVWVLFFIQSGLLNAFGQTLVPESFVGIITALAHAFAETHIAATLCKIYRDKESQEKYSLYTIWLPLVCAAVLVAGLLIPGVTGILLKIYLLWIAQHFVAQTYGLVLIYYYKNNYNVDAADKNVLKFLLNSTAALTIARQLSLHNLGSSSFLGQNLPTWSLLPQSTVHVFEFVLQLATSLFVIQVLRKAVFQRKLIPVPSMLMILTTVVSFVSTGEMNNMLWFLLPAFFHGSQYLVVTYSQYLKEKNQVRAANYTSPKVQQLGTALDFLTQLIVVAVALYVVIPAILHFCGFSYEQAFANVFVLLGLHHFITDSAIWKLRDPKVRKTLNA